jgi:tRNA nucleotidyltransferase/poly(A) polymerase
MGQPSSYKKELHKALKNAKNIDSLTGLTDRELWEYIFEIEAHFLSEYGIELLPEKRTLKELFDENNKCF